MSAFYRRFFIGGFYRRFFAGAGKKQCCRDSGRFKALDNLRFAPALLPPDPENIGDTATSPLANVNEVKHLEHGTVSGVGNPAALGRVNFDIVCILSPL